MKANLQITFNDDALIESLIEAAAFYAIKYQRHLDGLNGNNKMSAATGQDIVMLDSHFYVSQDTSTAGLWTETRRHLSWVVNRAAYSKATTMFRIREYLMT